MDYLYTKFTGNLNMKIYSNAFEKLPSYQIKIGKSIFAEITEKNYIEPQEVKQLEVDFNKYAKIIFANNKEFSNESILCSLDINSSYDEMISLYL